MPFVEAFRQFQFRVKKENFCLVHVSLVPQVCATTLPLVLLRNRMDILHVYCCTVFTQPRSTGEQKSKPTQSSVRELRSLGLNPDIIVCRSEKLITDSVQKKISDYCHVEPEQVGIDGRIMFPYM